MDSNRARGRISLKGRALKLLAQREHSRAELRRKLLPHAVASCAAVLSESSPGDHMDDVCDATAADAVLSDDMQPGPCLDKLLDWLESHGLLSQTRFVESRIRARAPKFGTTRIRLELAQHGVELPPGARQQLDRTEVERARQVWLRKFGEAAPDAAGRARQTRFLAARGFSSHAIRLAIRSPNSEPGQGGEQAFELELNLGSDPSLGADRSLRRDQGASRRHGSDDGEAGSVRHDPAGSRMREPQEDSEFDVRSAPDDET